MSMPDKTGKKAAQARKKDSTLGLRIIIAVLLLAVIALGALLFLARDGLIFALRGDRAQPGAEKPSALSQQDAAEPVRYTAWCYTPLSEVLSVTAEAGEPVELPQGPQIEGYSFIGWADEKGERVAGGVTALYADTAFSAVYAVAFRDESSLAHHEPYMSIGEDGLFRPEGSISRASAAKLLYSILDTELVGSGSFADVDPSAACYEATATLKDLGVIGGSRFHPDDPISCGEMFEMLSHFFPASTSAYSFDKIPTSDARYGAFCLAMDQGWIGDTAIDPDRNLTRAETAHIFNALRGRAFPAEADFAMVGTILDVSFDDPFFGDIAEAALAHDAERTEEGEIWTASEALPLCEEGFFFVGTALHCVDERGSAVVNASCGNFDFGADGVITTGMPELDALVQQTLVDLKLDPVKMDRERMLYIIFNYVTYHNFYLRDGDHLHEVGETGWANEEAYRMLTQKKGNCYNYAAEFYVLARAIGYDAVLYSGTITERPHGWVEIEMDGEPYIFDTEIEYKEVTINHKHSSYYKMPYWKAKGWHYFRGDEIEAAIAAKYDITN